MDHVRKYTALTFSLFSAVFSWLAGAAVVKGRRLIYESFAFRAPDCEWLLLDTVGIGKYSSDSSPQLRSNLLKSLLIFYCSPLMWLYENETHKYHQHDRSQTNSCDEGEEFFHRCLEHPHGGLPFPYPYPHQPFPSTRWG